MTVAEKPLMGTVDIQTPDYDAMGFVLGLSRLGVSTLIESPGDAWDTWIANATGVQMKRGGERSGLGIQTDVGIMSFVLKNDQDPINGGTFEVGQTVRAVQTLDVGDYGPADTPSRTNLITNPSFETDTTGWSSPGFGISLSQSSDQHYVGTHCLAASATVGGSHEVDYAHLSVTAGTTYTVQARMRANFSSGGSMSVTSDNGDMLTSNGGNVINASSWTEGSFTFTTVSDSPVKLSIIFVGIGVCYIDAVMVEEGSDLLDYFDGDTADDDGPGYLYDWTGTAEESTSTATALVPVLTTFPVFTGRISDISASYPFDKSTGTITPMVTVTVSDAVKVHGSTPRYGVRIGDGFETFESRILRLAGSAQAPIDVPTTGAPVGVYDF